MGERNTEKRTKYDTDPLDPDFLRRTNEIRDETDETVTLNGKLPHQHPSRVTEQTPTMRYADSIPESYPSVFAPPHEPPMYQPPTQSNFSPNSYTTPPGGLSKLGVSENVASMLPYTPLYIGAIVAIVELFLLPRTEVKTRSHASQGLALHLVILFIGLAFSGASFLAYHSLGSFSWFIVSLCGWLFSVSAFCYLIYSMWLVWKGKDTTIQFVSNFAKWINQHLDPIK
jgi:hypothetical protein